MAIASSPPPAAFGAASAFTAPATQQASRTTAGGTPCALRTVAPAAGPLRAEQLARELGIVGYDPSLRQAIELAGDDRPDADPRPDRRRARDRQVAAGPHDPRPRVDAAISRSSSSTTRPWPRCWPSTSGTATEPAALADAEADWSSKLHQAHGGTLFLNEVAGLPDNLQAHLLHALQEREFDGSTATATPTARPPTSGS